MKLSVDFDILVPINFVLQVAAAITDHCTAAPSITYIHKHMSFSLDRRKTKLLMTNNQNIKIDSKFDSDQVCDQFHTQKNLVLRYISSTLVL